MSRLWTVTLLLPVYILVAYGMIFLLNLDVPQWAEQAIVIVFGLPLQMLVAPWFYVLGQLGLMEGEWLSAPNLVGILLVSFLYGVVIYSFCRVILRIK